MNVYKFVNTETNKTYQVTACDIQSAYATLYFDYGVDVTCIALVA